jgi:hypothetical protein
MPDYVKIKQVISLGKNGNPDQAVQFFLLIGNVVRSADLLVRHAFKLLFAPGPGDA